MRSQLYLAAFLAALTSATTLPRVASNLTRRATCPDGDWCADCYADDSCGDEAVTMGVRHDSVNVGDIDLNQIADVIAGQCFEDTSTGLAACDASEVDLTTTLEGGASATIKVTVTAQAFQSWAKNLFVAAVAASFEGTARRNTVSGKDQDTITVATVPPSFFVALTSDPENTVTIGVVVVEDPQGDGSCGDILTVGGAIAGAAGPAGAAAGVVLTIASVFCSL